jgi:hypothetical protein
MRGFILYRDDPSCFQNFRLRALPVSPLRGIEFVSAIGRLPYRGTRCWNRFHFIGCTSLRILPFVALWSWNGLYWPRVLLYSAVFVVFTGVFIRRWFSASVAFETGDWYAVAISATFLAFLACNAISYAFWGRRTTKLQEPNV